MSSVGLRDVAVAAVSSGRGLTPLHANVWACRLHTQCRGQERSIHPEPFQPPCLDDIMWPSGSTFRTYELGDSMNYLRREV